MTPGSREISPNDDVTERTPKVDAPQVNPPTTPPSCRARRSAMALRCDRLQRPVPRRFPDRLGRQPVQPRAAGPGPVRGQRLRDRDDQRRPGRLQRQRDDRGRTDGAQCLPRLRAGDRPDDRRLRPVRDRSASCYYDADTQRWYHTDLTLEQDPVSGALTGATHVDIAVSQTSDPTGAWTIFHLDTTNGDGTLKNHPGCPCLGDQPLLGFDATGMYITTNEFSVNGPEFNGAQVYATSKWKLAAAAADNVGQPGVVVSFDGLPLAEGQAYSVQPADSVGKLCHRQQRHRVLPERPPVRSGTARQPDRDLVADRHEEPQWAPPKGQAPEPCDEERGLRRSRTRPSSAMASSS